MSGRHSAGTRSSLRSISVDDDALVAMVDEICAILADQDLSAVASYHPAHPEEPVAPGPLEAPPVTPAPLVGARFGGAGPTPRKARRSRRGR